MKRKYLIVLFTISAVITGYLYVTDDEGYPKSHDSIGLIISVFAFYTGIIFGMLIALFYTFILPFLKKK